MHVITETQTFGLLRVMVHPNRPAMGAGAAAMVAARLRAMLEEQDRVSMAFAAAPSQSEFLQALLQEEGIDWSRVIAFHLDEYIGIPQEHPSAFRQWLDRYFFTRVPLGQIHYLDSSATDPEAESHRYASLLQAHPLDIACIGIGENGHIAFNDPHVAEFDTPDLTKIVELDQMSRQQQVNDGCFATIDEVPRLAITLTIPALMAARFVSVVVPGPSKLAAVRATLTGPIETACPASILRTHGDSVLHVDPDAYPNPVA